MAENNLEAALSAGQQLAGFVRINEDSGLKHKDMEVIEVEHSPKSHKSFTTLESIASFIAYVKKYGDDGAHIYGSNGSGTEFSIKAVLYYVLPTDWIRGTPDLRKPAVIAEYKARPSRQLTTWKQSSSSWQSQENFAEFLDVNQKDIDEPPAAEVLEMISNFELKKDIAFRSVVRVKDGTFTVAYDEQDKVHVKGQLVFPGKISIFIPLFHNGEKHLIDLALRYRLKEGVLSMQYRLVDLEEKIEDAIQGIVNKVTEETGLPLYAGSIH